MNKTSQLRLVAAPSPAPKKKLTCLVPQGREDAVVTALEALGVNEFSFAPVHRAKRQAIPITGPWPSVEAVTTLYNELTPDECPGFEKLSDGRIKKIRQYLAAFPDEDFWRGAFQQIHYSDFLRGKTGWKAVSLDWLLTKGKDGTENIVKVSEGHYQNG